MRNSSGKVVTQMNSENENRNEQLLENEAVITETADSEVSENTDKDNEENESSAAEEFISEFAPAPINIPNYNKQKAMQKREKANAKKKKQNSRKSKKRRRMLRKVLFVVRTILLFLLLFAVIFTTISVLVTKINTSEFSVESTIRTHEPERFVVGKVKNPSKLNLKQSSMRASVADILRDNSMILVTYDDIQQAVRKSSYPDYVAKKAHDVLNYYLYGKPYKEITASEISNLLLDNVSYIKLVTGQELGDTACKALGKRIAASSALKETQESYLEKQPLSRYTYITSVMLSMPTLIGLVIALLLLLVLTVISCGGFVHRMIGWACMLSGIIMCTLVGASKILFKPLFKPATEFIRCVAEAIRNGFVSSALIYGGLMFLLGLIIMLIGHAMADSYDEDEEIDEADYIDGIEQVSTAQ